MVPPHPHQCPRAHATAPFPCALHPSPSLPPSPSHAPFHTVPLPQPASGSPVAFKSPPFPPPLPCLRQESRGVQVSGHKWSDSGHCEHMRTHPHEYAYQVSNFITNSLKDW